MSTSYKPGDYVDVLLGPNKRGRIRGMVEDVGHRGVGVRYENGNFFWVKDESRLLPGHPVRGLRLGSDRATKLARRFLASAVIVGDIFSSSWGYDQTNVDFYQVVRTTPKMIAIRRINSQVVSGKGQPQEKVMPIANTFHRESPTLKKKLKEYNGRAYVTLNSYSSAYKWDGKAKWQTGGMGGH